MNNSVYPKIYALIKENASNESLKENINKYASGYLIVIILAIIFTLITVPFAVHFFIKNPYYHKSLAFLGILTIGQIFKVLYYFSIRTVWISLSSKSLPHTGHLIDKTYPSSI
jgi:hypothetical protein